jgi:hypothetical protein
MVHTSWQGNAQLPAGHGMGGVRYSRVFRDTALFLARALEVEGGGARERTERKRRNVSVCNECRIGVWTKNRSVKEGAGEDDHDMSVRLVFCWTLDCPMQSLPLITSKGCRKKQREKTRVSRKRLVEGFEISWVLKSIFISPEETGFSHQRLVGPWNSAICFEIRGTYVRTSRSRIRKVERKNVAACHTKLQT